MGKLALIAAGLTEHIADRVHPDHPRGRTALVERRQIGGTAAVPGQHQAIRITVPVAASVCAAAARIVGQPVHTRLAAVRRQPPSRQGIGVQQGSQRIRGAPLVLPVKSRAAML